MGHAGDLFKAARKPSQLAVCEAWHEIHTTLTEWYCQLHLRKRELTPQSGRSTLFCNPKAAVGATEQAEKPPRWGKLTSSEEEVDNTLRRESLCIEQDERIQSR